MFRIGDFSRLSSISIRMLRYYDKMGLLSPVEVDRFTGFRSYSAAQLEQANKIQHLKSLGFSLAMVKEMLEKNNTQELEQYFSLRQMEIEEELRQVNAQSKLLERAIGILKGDQTIMEYTTVLKDFPAGKVASVRGILPDYSQEGLLWGKLFEGLASHKLFPAEKATTVAVYHDKEFKETNTDVEVRVEMDSDHEDFGEVKFYTTAPVQVASVTFNGSYDLMSRVTEAAAAWIESNGYQMDGPMFNIYYVGPTQEHNPEKWVTEACFPVTKQ